MRALIVGGGTGGHVIPGLAIARELRDRHRAECLFVGTPRGLEGKLVPAAGFAIEMVTVGQFNNVSFRKRLRTALDLPRSVIDALRIMSHFHPNVVISVGGYASGPGAAAAIFRRTPLLAFEPNLVPGMANRAVARLVTAAAVHFPQTAKMFRNAEVTGVPVRREFFDVPPVQACPDAPNLLVFGGSQGARAINDAFIAALPALEKKLPHLRIVHQTGTKDLDRVRAAYSSLTPGTRLATSEVRDFISDMATHFSVAQAIVCRSGASTAAEVAAAGRAAIFIPFPQAADDHQTKNAEAFAACDAALLLAQSQLTAESLIAALLTLLSDPVKLARMGANARQMSHPRAAERIAEMAAHMAK